MRKITINNLIAKLEEAKKEIGGDKFVHMWDEPCGPTYYFDPTSFDGEISLKIASDKSSIGLEIYRVDF
jgi:hypothetical protein